MRKRFGLAIVGVAIATGGGVLCAITLDVASRFTSHARENQPILVASTLAQRQMLADSSQANDTPELKTTDQDDLNTKIPTLKSSALSIPSSSIDTRSTTQRYTQSPSEDIPKTPDGERFGRIMEKAIAQKLAQRPMGELMQAIANQFLGAAYKGNLLDQSSEETLVVTLNQFDCVLFVETVLAIARGVAVQDYSYSTFVNHLRNQRYWDGQIDGYCSRLHYFSQWIYDNQKRGTVQNLGLKLGGVALNKKLNFMSTHRQSYPPMAKDNANYQCMVEREAQLDGITVDYIPTNKIRNIYSQLQPGDIIAVATNISGLDVTHTGLVYRQSNGNMGFIHASPAGQVTIARDLQRYISRVKNAIGIVVARPLDPRSNPVR